MVVVVAAQIAYRVNQGGLAVAAVILPVLEVPVRLAKVMQAGLLADLAAAAAALGLLVLLAPDLLEATGAMAFHLLLIILQLHVVAVAVVRHLVGRWEPVAQVAVVMPSAKPPVKLEQQTKVAAVALVDQMMDLVLIKLAALAAQAS